MINMEVQVHGNMMNKILIAFVLAVVMSGNVFADAQSKCLKAVEKGKETAHVNPNRNIGQSSYKVYVYKGGAYRFYYLDGECRKIG